MFGFPLPRMVAQAIALEPHNASFLGKLGEVIPPPKYRYRYLCFCVPDVQTFTFLYAIKPCPLVLRSDLSGHECRRCYRVFLLGLFRLARVLVSVIDFDGKFPLQALAQPCSNTAESVINRVRLAIYKPKPPTCMHFTRDEYV